MCYDLDNNTYEPLGLQKLMIKHLESVSTFKIVPIFEYDFYSEVDKFEFIDRTISKEFMKMNN